MKNKTSEIRAGVHVKIPLTSLATSIPKKNVNHFLMKLWDKFNASLGRVGCVHYYRPTPSQEVYEYRIHWSDNQLPFEAELHFFNHTAKGIIEIEFGAIDNNSKKKDVFVEYKIKEAIMDVLKMDLAETQPIQAYMYVPFQTKKKLAGSYRLVESDLLIINVDDEEGCTGHLFFPVFSTNSSDLTKEAEDKATKICTRLTAITQNLFVAKLDLPRGKFTTDEFRSIVSRYSSCDIFIDDSGFLKFKNTAPNTPITNEIIEADDCIVNSHIALPKQTDFIMRAISTKDDYQQSCARFAEGLYLRDLISLQQLPPQSISYELIAYTATIEALLDSEKITKEIKCPKCNTTLLKEDWKISEKYKLFIIRLCVDDYLYKKYFRPLYEDRSKFVHTGKDLYDFTARRQGRPALLLGKRIATSRPEYYESIHDLTGWLLRKHLYISASSETTTES